MALLITSGEPAKKLYRTLWRWHFYAGLFALPFVIILSLSGAVYLFKPQLDALHDKPYRNLVINDSPLTPSQQLAAASSAVAGASFSAYELPRASDDAINIILSQAGEKIRVYIHPQTGAVLAQEDEDARFLRWVHDLHGELLLGNSGAILVELAACWAIVLILTGMYLWWPRQAKGLGGVLYPRINLTGRLFWRDVHCVVGIWISTLVLFLLISGLPWALVWGGAFKELRSLGAATSVKQDWTTASKNIANNNNPLSTKTEPSEHSDAHADHGQMAPSKSAENYHLLNQIVAQAHRLQLAHPVLIAPPSEKSPQWSVKSNAQNRTLRAEAYFDKDTGQQTRYQSFTQRPLTDRIIGIGIAAHEGQLFGWLNQLLGLLTALSLITLCISGFIMWRKRAPNGALGAPPPVPDARLSKGFIAIILLAAIVLPVLGASLIVILALEQLVLRKIPRARDWLGLA